MVLLLVLAAGGVLVGAVVTGHPQWAWASVLLSTAAAAGLIASRVRRRRDSRTGSTREASETPETPGSADPPEGRTADSGTSEDASAVPVGASEGSQTESSKAASSEPGEEDTDAADALVVSESEASVVVVDERPRYHLDDCVWASRYDTIPVPVREARELGFTPCGLCEPDATLAARERAPS